MFSIVLSHRKRERKRERENKPSITRKASGTVVLRVHVSFGFRFSAKYHENGTASGGGKGWTVYFRPTFSIPAAYGIGWIGCIMLRKPPYPG